MIAVVALKVKSFGGKEVSLVDVIKKEIERNEVLLATYETLPDGAGEVGAAFLRRDLKEAKETIISMDAVDMLTAYTQLRGNK